MQGEGLVTGTHLQTWDCSSFRTGLPNTNVPDLNKTNMRLYLTYYINSPASRTRFRNIRPFPVIDKQSWCVADAKAHVDQGLKPGARYSNTGVVHDVLSDASVAPIQDIFGPQSSLS